MIGPSLLSDLGGPVWAKLAVIGAAVSYAFAVVYAKRFKDIKSSVVATGQLTASTILMVPIVFLFYRPGEIVTSPAKRSAFNRSQLFRKASCASSYSVAIGLAARDKSALRFVAENT